MRILLIFFGCLVGCLCVFNKNNIKLNVKGRTLTVTLPYDSEYETIFFSTDVNDNCYSNYTFVTNPSRNAANGYEMAVNKVIQKDDTIKIFGVFGSNNKLETQIYNFKIDDTGNGVVQKSNRFATKKCTKSETEVNFEKQLCSGIRIFEENFDDPQLSNWKPEILSKIFAPPLDQEYVAYVNYKKNLYVEGSKLYLNATWENNRAIKKFELENCTSRKKGRKRDLECGPIMQRPGLILPPVYSAKVNTLDKMTFKYGRIEIRAIMPIGDWLFPYLILQPVNTYSESLHVNQLRIGYVRGNKVLLDNKSNLINGEMLFGSAVLWSTDTHKEYMNAKKGKFFGKSFHNYTLIWQKDRISFKVDGLTYGTITDPNVLHTFSLNECFIVLGLTAGGSVNFRDDYLKSHQKKFLNDDRKAAELFSETKKIFLSWEQPSLIVDYVHVYTI